jgi:hypothetical protein
MIWWRLGKKSKIGPFETPVSNGRRRRGPGEERLEPDDEDDERHRDFTRRRRLYKEEGRGVVSGWTEMGG